MNVSVPGTGVSGRQKLSNKGCVMLVMLILVMVVMLIGSLTLVAQTKTPPGPTKVGVTFKIIGDTEDSIAETIGPGLYEKSEFESKAEYIKRIKAWIAKTLYPSSRPLNESVLIYSRSDMVRYDAEERQFDISFYRVLRYPLRESENQRIEIVRWDGSSWESIFSLPSLSFKAEPQVAKIIKPLISVAVYGAPVSGNTTGRRIKFVPSRIVAFNRETDEIYAIRELPNYFEPANIQDL